jgi:hypothetical protein
VAETDVIKRDVTADCLLSSEFQVCQEIWKLQTLAEFKENLFVLEILGKY